MKYYAVSDEDLQILSGIARSLYFANEKLFAGSNETTRDYCAKIRKILEKVKELELPENFKDT